MADNSAKLPIFEFGQIRFFMKKIISVLKKILHIHWFNKPIASQYISFHNRNIVYECRCGKRKLKMVVRAFGDPFPIETNNLITDTEIKKIISSKTN